MPRRWTVEPIRGGAQVPCGCDLLLLHLPVIGIHDLLPAANAKPVSGAAVEDLDNHFVGCTWCFQLRPCLLGERFTAKGRSVRRGRGGPFVDLGVIEVHHEDSGDKPPGEKQTEGGAGPAMREDGDLSSEARGKIIHANGSCAVLRQTIDREIPALRALTDEDAARTPKPGSWSPKQELGHLIDSAANNHMRFVVASIEGALRGLALRAGLLGGGPWIPESAVA